MSTLTASDTASWDATSLADFARADSPSEVLPVRMFEGPRASPPRRDTADGRLTSPPSLPRRRTADFRRQLVSDLVDQVTRLASPDPRSPPTQPRPTPRTRRDEAEARLHAATATLRHSLSQSFQANSPTRREQSTKFVNLRKPVFFRDIRSNQ